MEITFVGTSSGKTNLRRYHSSLLFSSNDEKLLIDAGDGIARALVKQKINLQEINAILITHFHADHVFGICSLLTQMKMQKRNKPLKIFVFSKLASSLKKLFEIGYIFIDYFPFKIDIIEFQNNVKNHSISSISFIPKENNHIHNKYNLEIETPFTSHSFLFKEKQNSVAYSSDINNYNDLLLFKGYNIHTLITEGAHVTFTEIEKAIDELNPNNTYITHVDDENLELFQWYNCLTASEKEKIIIANDGLRISL